MAGTALKTRENRGQLKLELPDPNRLYAELHIDMKQYIGYRGAVSEIVAVASKLLLIDIEVMKNQNQRTAAFLWIPRRRIEIRGGLDRIMVKLFRVLGRRLILERVELK